MKCTSYLKRWASLWIPLLVLTITGCDSSNQVKDLRMYVANLREAKGLNGAKKAEGELTGPTPASYHPDAIRTPFMSSANIQVGKGGASNPLLTYPITMLRFVGTVTQNKQTYAFVATPEGLVYQVKQGDVLGDHGGKIESIGPDRIKLTEIVTEKGKAATSKVVTLELREEANE